MGDGTGVEPVSSRAYIDAALDSIGQASVVDFGPIPAGLTGSASLRERSSELVAAADSLCRRCTSASQWFLAGGAQGDRMRRLNLPPLGIVSGLDLIELVGGGLVVGAQLDRGSRHPDGSPVVAPFVPMEHAAFQLRMLIDGFGGGVLLPGLERLPTLRDLHFELTSATQARVTIALVTGSFDLRGVVSASTATAVWNLGPDLIVGSADTAAVVVRRGVIHWTSSPARVVGDERSLCLVVGAEPCGVNGRGGEQLIPCVAPFAPADAGSDAPVLVRGRFPGGVHLAAADERAVLLLAEGRVFAVARQLGSQLALLLGGQPVAVGRDVNDELVGVFVRAGLVEPVAGGEQ